MNIALRVVTQLPVVELWQPNGFVTKQRGSFLTPEKVIALLRRSQVQFVVANVGKPLQWIDPANGFELWRREIRSHLANPEENVLLSAFPDEYCYSASQWEGADLPIVLLETHH